MTTQRDSNGINQRDKTYPGAEQRERDNPLRYPVPMHPVVPIPMAKSQRDKLTVTPGPTELLTLCAFCWRSTANRRLRSTGGWWVGCCDRCHDRHEQEPHLRPETLPTLDGTPPPGRGSSAEVV